MNTPKKLQYAGVVIGIVAGMFLASTTLAKTKAKAGHPNLSQQEKLIDCAECHKDATPSVEKEWFDSVHGVAMVKCYQCHGTFETFTVTPKRSTCGTCHTKMLTKCPQNKPCWECHVPHSFKAAK